MPKLTQLGKAALESGMKESMRSELISMYAELDSDSVTMEKLAERLSIAKGTIYNYYKNKDELLTDTFLTTRKNLNKRLESVAESSGTPISRIKKSIKILLEDFEKTHKVFLEFIRIRKDKNFHAVRGNDIRHMTEVLASHIADGVKSGDFRKVDPQATAEMLLGAVIGLNKRAIYAKQRTIEESARLLDESFLQGLAKK